MKNKSNNNDISAVEFDGIQEIFKGISSINARDRGSGKNFNLLDFYIICHDYGIDIERIRWVRKKSAKDSLLAGQCDIISSFYSKCIKSVNACSSMDLQQILDTSFTFGDREITLEEKKMILKELEGLEIPINDVTFSLAVRRYVNGSFDINNGNART